MSEQEKEQLKPAHLLDLEKRVANLESLVKLLRFDVTNIHRVLNTLEDYRDNR